MATQYQRGRSFEYAVRDYLTKRGYFVVRSAQSKGAADLIAIRGGFAKLVQCKLGKAFISSAEWNELHDIATGCGCSAYVAWRPRPRAKIRIFEIQGRREKGERFLC